MSYINGFVLIDVDVAALNNAGQDNLSHFKNSVATKKITKNGRSHVYVSGQAWRYWWRETLIEDFGWQMSPIERAKLIAFTATDPIDYPDDDMFGYMRADKKNTGLSRISPLKNSALISVSPSSTAQHFSSMARQQGDAVPFHLEEYCAVLKGMFSIAVEQVGTFSDFERSGFKNINDDLKKKVKKKGGPEINDPILKDKKGNPLKLYRLDDKTRINRLTDVIRALETIHGGAKLSTNYADVTPKLIVLASSKYGNHPFSHLAVDNKGKPEFSIAALKQAYKDYEDGFIGNVYIGRCHGFLDHLESEFKALEKTEFSYHNSVREAIKNYALDNVKKLIKGKYSNASNQG